jgi:predicted SnoaL-like aldol condensation-catalyzing enzyme
MKAITDLVEAGALRAHIEATFALAEAAKAHALAETGRTTGKIVLTVEGTGKAEIAEGALRGVFASGDTSVVDRFIRPDYIQHNPLAADGREAMKAFGAGWRLQFPDATYDLKHAICQGDLVLLHTHGVTVPGTRGLAIFDIFRFKDGMIAEHWDILQEVPDTTANGTDIFATVSEPPTNVPQQRWLTTYNKNLVTAFVDQLLVRKDLDAVDTYVAPQYQGHNPDTPSDGARGLKAVMGAYFEQFPQLRVSVKRVIAEGDLVAVHSHHVTTPAERGQAVIDLFRVRDSQIVEHWHASQDVPETSANDNTMF